MEDHPGRAAREPRVRWRLCVFETLRDQSPQAERCLPSLVNSCAVSLINSAHKNAESERTA